MIWVQFPAPSNFSFALLSFFINKNKQTKQKKNKHKSKNKIIIIIIITIIIIIIKIKKKTIGNNHVIHYNRLKKKIERRSLGESRHGPPSILSYCPAKTYKGVTLTL